MDKDLDPVSLIESINKEFEERNYERVIDLCQEGVQNFIEFPLIYFFLIKSFLKLKKYKEAKEIFYIAINKFPYNRSIIALQDEIEPKEIINSRDSEVIGANFQQNEAEFEQILKKSFIFHFHFNLDKLFVHRKFSF